MADESTSYSDLISRRRFVELTGVTGAAALAGCDGDGDGDTDTETPGGGDTDTPGGGDTDTPGGGGDDQPEYPDVEHISVETTPPADLQWNPFNSSGAPSVADRLLFEKFAQYSYASSEFMPAGLTDWSLEDGTFTMKLREGLTWSNGEPVTAEDLELQFSLGALNEAPYWDYIDETNVVDDRTFELEVVDDVNTVILESSLFAGANLLMKIDQETYGDFADADNPEDLRSFVDDEPVTNGPFAHDTVSDQALVTKHVGLVDGADSPWASNINFGQYTFEEAGNNQQRIAALRALDVDSDFSVAVPARTMAGFPAAVAEANYFDVWGYGIYPNHTHQHAGDRAVRQAMAYAINRDQCVLNSLPRAKIPVSYALGISDAAGNQDTWLGDAADDYETYGVDSTMTDQVNTVMQDAGYSKVDGTWQDSDGNTVSLPVTAPSGWGDWVAMTETIISNLQDVGFESSFDGISSFLAAGNRLKSGDFTVGTGPWLHGGPLTHPYFSLQHNLAGPQISGQEVMSNYPSWSEEWGGSRENITVPSRTGSGEEEVDVNSLITEMSQTNDEETIQNHTHKLAWVSNVDLPTIPIVDKVLQTWLTTDDWTTPVPIDEEPESKVQFAPTWLPRKGKMNWRGD